MAKEDQHKAFDSFIERTKLKLNKEVGHLETDIQSVVCEKGQVSEAERWKDTANELSRLVDILLEESDDTSRLLEGLGKTIQ